jgi:hypothetical protein
MNLILWSIPLWLLAVLLCLLIRRRIYKAYPWFLAYVAFGVIAGIARFFTLNHPRTYFVTYWLSDAVYALLGAMAMYELLRKVLRDLADIWWTHLIFPSVIAIGVGLSIWRVYEVPPQVHGRLLLCIVTGEIAVRFVQILVFVGLVAFIAFFGFRWRQYPLGIAAGFGFYSTVALLITTKLSDIGTRFTFLWGVISLVAYSLAVVIWIGFFSVPQMEEPPPDPELVARYIAVLEQYLGVLRRIR